MSLNPNEKPFLKRRWNDNWSEWYVRQPRPHCCVDRAVAAKRPHLILRHGRRARTCVRGQRRILVLRQERLPKSTAFRFTFCSVLKLCCPTYDTSSDDGPGQQHLHAGVPLRGRRQLAVVLVDVQRRRPVGRQAPGAERLQLTVPHGHVLVGRRVLDLRERLRCRPAGRRTVRRRRAARSCCRPVRSYAIAEPRREARASASDRSSSRCPARTGTSRSSRCRNSARSCRSPASSSARATVRSPGSWPGGWRPCRSSPVGAPRRVQQWRRPKASIPPAGSSTPGPAVSYCGCWCTSRTP